MKDIDFDELDRAVNSLMNGVPKTEPAADGAENISEQVANTADTTAGKDTKSSAKIDPPSQDTKHPDPLIKAELEPESSPSTSSSDAVSTPGTRRRGRFMDVVRPQMPEITRPNPSRSVSRRGATIEPGRADSSLAVSSPDTANTSSAPPFSSSVESADGLNTDHAKDALAAESSKDTGITESLAAEMPPLTASPFLPDAKVEKRPLGRPTDADGVEQPVSGALAEESESTSEPHGDLAIPEQPLPVELSQEVVAIESVTEGPAAGTYGSTVESEILFARSAANGTPHGRAGSPMAGSISQQYKVEAKTSETSPGAIYDTATYHQPLSHPVAKKPGWLWVVAIVVILLLGAASGAAAYFLGLV